jgi:hypothetical protein
MSGNYQSRVFIFINNRTNKLKDSCAKGLRQLKVAVVWSGQILLYPLQVLAQTAKIFPPQLSSPLEQLTFPSPPVSDINIEQALDLVAGAGYPIEIAASATLAVAERLSSDVESSRLQRHTPAMMAVADDNSIAGDGEITFSPHKSHQATCTQPIVRGLSSLLVDRRLVLVTTENELIDILTLYQQQEIRRRIGSDLAINWYHWHRRQLSIDGTDRQLSADRSLLFDDQNLIERIAGNRQDVKQLNSVDRDNRSSKLSERLDDWWQNLAAKTLEFFSLTLKPKIDQAEPKFPLEMPSASDRFTPQPSNISRFLDLPQLPPFIETPPGSSDDSVIDMVPQNSGYANTKLQPNWMQQWWNYYYRKYLNIPAKDDRQVIDQPTEFKLTRLGQKSENRIDIISKKAEFRATSRNPNLIEQSFSELSKQNYQNVEYHPDWIEAQSEIIGYKTSLIAKLLAWLDRAILIIENWLIKILHL